ncbi:MAG: superfamily II DNA or RNA helicase, partial [Cognaticolwellia sp.]
RLPGWLVNVDHVRSMLAPVLCRPLKRGGGLRTWRNSLARCQTPLPQDREVKEILSQTDFQHGSDARARSANNRALLALEGHPRLVSDQGQLITVRRAQLLMVWVPTQDGGVRVEPTLWGRALSGGELSALVNRWGAELSPLLESKTGRCAVVQLPPVQLALLQTLRKRGAVFPAASRDALMQRFGTMSSLIPMELRGELRGEQVPGDARPLLRLSLAADGALDLQALSRPLEDVRAWPPGHGPAELSTIREGHRVYCVRELDKEPRRIEQALAPLDLPASEEFSWTLDEPDQGLSTVQTLRELDDAFHLEWARPQPIISRGATAEDLKVRGAKQRDWFGLTGSLEVEGQVVPLADLLDAVRNNRRFVRVGERGWVALTSTLRASLEATATLARDSKKGVELPPMASAALLALEEAGATVELPRSLRVQQKRLREAATLRTQVPENLNAELRPYQREGFEWLARLAHWAPGAVLADDMGLGKTVQALALLLRRAEDGSALVVAPASVGINWLREAQRFAPSLRVRSYRGPDRGSLLDDLNPGDVLVTSWELMTRDAVALKEAGFHTAVLDEAQAIKNASTRRSRASADLGAAFTLALTGTPVENRVGELWSLMRTVVPGLLGSAQRFRERVVLPIERDGAQQPRRALSQLLRPFLLRRVKSQVAQDLPPRTDSIVRVELSPAERALYDTFRVSTIAELQGGAESSKGGAKRFRILAALTRLRQLACHPALVFPDDPTRSTKLDRLVETLVDLKAEGHRALVFSQFTTLLGFARQALEQVGLEVRYLDGSTSLKKRQAQVDAFQAGGGDAFLISLKAGGTGLNLTAASYVFHLDPWWNPSVEDQATDRAHRIGQTQPVTVIRLVAADTIEEVVLAMHAEKRALVSDLLEGTGKVSLEAGEPVPAKAKKPPVEVAAPPAAVKAAPTEPGDLLTRYQALLDQEIALGTLRSMPTVRNYYRAVRNLLAWTQTQAGSITDLESVELWTSRYLKALRAGELTSGKSDLYFHGPSFSRLRRLVASESV